jgi:hypothetical protein
VQTVAVAPNGQRGKMRHAERRWDGDERGEGIADARNFVPAAASLADAMQHGNWVAEEPDLHLLPHLRHACESLPFELVDARTAWDGSFDVDLRWLGATKGIGEIRAAVFALVGGFAELSTYVRQRTDGDSIVFDVVTGFLDGESRLDPHGHTLRLSVL